MEAFSDVWSKQRAVIEFLTAEKKFLQLKFTDECKPFMVISVFDVSTVRRWVRRFKDGELGQAYWSDKTRSGRPVTASDQLHQDSSTLSWPTALEGCEGSASCPGCYLSPGKTRYALYRRLGGPQGRSGRVREISPPPGFDPRTIQPVASRYTNYTTWPTDVPVQKHK